MKFMEDAQKGGLCSKIHSALKTFSKTENYCGKKPPLVPECNLCLAKSVDYLNQFLRLNKKLYQACI